MPQFQREMDASKANAKLDFAVGPYPGGCVQVNPRSGSTIGATYTIKRSLDGATYFGFPLPVVILGSGISRRLDLRGVAALRVEATGADATSPALADVTVQCEETR